MNRREILSAAAIAGPLSMAGVQIAAQDAVEPTRQTGPTMDDLINLVLHGTDFEQGYYGRVLAKALRLGGDIARDDGDGWVTTFKGHTDGTDGPWRRQLTRSSQVSVPEDILPHFRTENRGSDFPAGIPFKPLKPTYQS